MAPYGQVDKTKMCAFSPNTGTCQVYIDFLQETFYKHLDFNVLNLLQGDSGGPLTVDENGHYVVVGITSYGFGCGYEDPDVFTRVTAYLDWIREIIKDGECKLPA